MSIKSTQKSNILFDFFYRYWVGVILLIILSNLIQQNFIDNNLPLEIYQKQQLLNKNIIKNQDLIQENQQLKFELLAKSDKKLEILESIAREKFGFIKKGEKYYQISIFNQD